MQQPHPLLKQLNSQDISNFIYQWATHLPHQPEIHTQLLGDYLLQPCHQWTCVLPKTTFPTPVKVHAIQWLPSLGLEAGTPDILGQIPPNAPTPSKLLYPFEVRWFVETPDGTQYILSSITRGTQGTHGPILTAPNLTNIPNFLTCTLPTEPPTVLVPIQFAKPTPSPCYDINDWQAHISLSPRNDPYDKKAPSATAYIQYFHRVHGLISPFSAPIPSPYFELCPSDLHNIFLDLKTGFANFLSLAFALIDQTYNTLQPYCKPPVLTFSRQEEKPGITAKFESTSDTRLSFFLETIILRNSPSRTPTLRINPRWSIKTDPKTQDVLFRTVLFPVATSQLDEQTQQQVSSLLSAGTSVFESAYNVYLSC